MGLYIVQHSRPLDFYFSLDENIFSFYGEQYNYNGNIVNIPYNERKLKYCYLGIG